MTFHQILTGNIHEDSFEAAKTRDTRLSSLVELGTIEKTVEVDPDLLASGGEDYRVALLKIEAGIHARDSYPTATHIFGYQEQETTTPKRESSQPKVFKTTGKAYGPKQ